MGELVSQPRKLIGYWPASLEALFLPLPQELVGASSSATRKAVCRYLRRGSECEAYRGHSWCRFRCGIDNWKMGSRELTDGEWVWPEGLVHYVESHGVVLPEEFVASATADRKRPIPPELPEGEGDSNPLDSWVDWGRSRHSAPLRRRLEQVLYEAQVSEAILIDRALDEVLSREVMGKEPCTFDQDCPRPALEGRDLCAFHHVVSKPHHFRQAYELYQLPSDL